MKTNIISGETIVSQVKGNIVSDMDGEKVMLSVERGKYYNLGELGGVIWDLLEKETTINTIVETLSEMYEVEYEECKNQVISFLDHLLEEELIHI